MRILIVEDETDLREAMAEGLKMDGYAVDTCGDGNTAYELLYVENYDLVVLDLNLPGMDGLDVLCKIRNEKPNLKVLILSARNSVSDKVTGLDCGANDYLAKPFDFAELEARIRNLLRRQYSCISSKLSFDNLHIDLARRVAVSGEKEIALTKKEFALLEYFALNPNRVISQDTVNLRDVLEDIAAELTPFAEKQNITLQLNCDDCKVMGNLDLLYRAFYNLVENAIRYNKENGSVTMEAKQVADRKAEIIISDTGIGIPDDMKKQIFEPFFRVDKSRSRAMGGAGLGLSVVKQIMDKHNGSIIITDSEDGGSCFKIVL